MNLCELEEYLEKEEDFLCELKEYLEKEEDFFPPLPPLMLAFLREIKSKVTNQLTWMNMRMWLLFPSKLVDHNKKKCPKTFIGPQMSFLQLFFL